MDENALSESWMDELRDSDYGDEVRDKQISKDESLKFKIQSVNSKGKVVLKFNEPVFEFSSLNERQINVEYCKDKDCKKQAQKPPK